MKIKKQIRVVSMQSFRSAKESEMEQMQRYEMERPVLSVRRQRSNSFDKDALLVEEGRKKVGYVNADDKRWIMPLVKKGVAKSCKMVFDHIVWPKDEQSSAVMKCLIEIDIDEVEKQECEYVWDDFRYTFPQLPVTSSMDDLHFALEMLLTKLCRKSDAVDVDVDDMLTSVIENCRYDMSKETTDSINEVCFCLEMMGDKVSDERLDRLETASTHRRSRRGEAEWRQWFGMLTDSSEATYLWNCYVNEKKREQKAAELTTEHMEADLQRLEQELLCLPCNLYMYVDKPERLIHSAFYLNIPETKQMEVLSALVLRQLLKRRVMPDAADVKAEEVVSIQELKMPEQKELSEEDDGEKVLLDELTPVFKFTRREARDFVNSIRGQKPRMVTQRVSILRRERKIDEEMSHRTLWKILHAAGLYRCSESNWNMQI